ncbi:hypothetical protein [Radiobacillus sp. PE A8.2]|uniref:hypothetical protein n=1 Tax=Radiobacillus sp. PE A8.2 TaxID=3380349 RepID=UPI00388E3445
MYNNLFYTTHNDEYVNRWLLSKTKFEAFNSEPATFSQTVNLTEEYVQIEYPVRKEFLEKRKNQKKVPSEIKFDQIYFPFENPRVEFSAFIQTPHTLSTFAKTYIVVDDPEKVPFQIMTCGGVEIWVNNAHQVSYTPYTRNLPSAEIIHLSLEKGENEIIVYFDELAERDVNYYFSLQYKGTKPLQGFIPVRYSTAKITEVEQLLDNMFLEKDLFTDGFINIQLANMLMNDYDYLYVKVNQNELLNPVFVEQEINESNTGIKPSQFTVNIDDQLDKNRISIGHIEEFGVRGITHFDIGLKVDDGLIIYRRFVVTINNANEDELQVSDILVKRKKEVLDFLSEIPVKDFNRGIARTALYGEVDEKTKDLIRSGFRVIEEKGDCADFRLAPILAYAIKYKSLIPEDLMTEIKDLALNFRYWIDEPGNDVMWYFSENHAFLFHVSQYFAGYLYSENSFVVSDRSGEEQYQMGKERLEEWFDIFFKYGFSEWNSTTYLPIDLIGFLSLYEAAPDQQIRDLSKKALDFTFEILAANLYGKTMSSTYGRVYEHDLKAMELGEVSNLAFIAWKKGNLNRSIRSTVLFCLSDYEPPNFDHYLEIEDEKAVLTEYVQGIKKVYTYSFKTNYYACASAINFNTFKKGHQQHLMNVSLGKDNTQFWMNNPGERVYSGENRPSFWAGNGVCPNIRQYKNCMLIEYRLDEAIVPFIHAYIPFWKLDEIVDKDKWFFARKNNSYLAFYFHNGYKYQKEKAIAYREVRSYGDRNLVVVRCSSKEEIGSFQAFQNRILSSVVSEEKQEEWSYQDFQHGSFKMTKDGNLMLNGKGVLYEGDYELSSTIERL